MKAKVYNSIKVCILISLLGIILAICIPMITKPIPVIAAPIMEVDSTVIIIHNSSKNLDSIK